VVRIDLAELGLPALDALEVDALAVHVGPERPLQGLAGFADWRLCGALSRAIRAGDYGPESGEALLLPSGGRLRVPRIFCFGLAEAPLAGAALAAACRRVNEAMARAGSAAFAAALPPHRLEDGPAAARLWLEACLAAGVRRQVLLGDARVLLRDLTVAREQLGAAVDVVPPVLRVELPPRAPASGAPAAAPSGPQRYRPPTA
jgi:hypothetical protein